MPGICTCRISHAQTKPFLRVRMPGICACACVYRTSVNQALGKSEYVTAQGSYADCCSNDGGEEGV